MTNLKNEKGCITTNPTEIKKGLWWNTVKNVANKLDYLDEMNKVHLPKLS